MNFNKIICGALLFASTVPGCFAGDGPIEIPTDAVIRNLQGKEVNIDPTSRMNIREGTVAVVEGAINLAGSIVPDALDTGENPDYSQTYNITLENGNPVFEQVDGKDGSVYQAGDKTLYIAFKGADAKIDAVAKFALIDNEEDKTEIKNIIIPTEAPEEEQTFKDTIKHIAQLHYPFIHAGIQLATIEGEGAEAKLTVLTKETELDNSVDFTTDSTLPQDVPVSGEKTNPNIALRDDSMLWLRLDAHLDEGINRLANHIVNGDMQGASTNITINNDQLDVALGCVIPTAEKDKYQAINVTLDPASTTSLKGNNSYYQDGHVFIGNGAAEKTATITKPEAMPQSDVTIKDQGILSLTAAGEVKVASGKTLSVGKDAKITGTSTLVVEPGATLKF